MRTIVLDGREMVSKEAFHQIVARELDLPAWYGKNLDALYDCLTDIGEDTQIMFRYLGQMQDCLGEYTQQILSAFLDAQEENDHLAVALMGDEEED